MRHPRRPYTGRLHSHGQPCLVLPDIVILHLESPTISSLLQIHERLKNPRYKPQVPIYAIIGTHLLYYAIIFTKISHTDYFPSPVYWVIIFNAHKHTYSTLTSPRLYYLYLHIATLLPPSQCEAHTPLPHLN